MPRRETSRASSLFSTLKAMVCALFKLIAGLFAKETVKPPLEAIESPVRLVVLSPDGNPNNNFSQDAPPFKLCHGATHTLEVKALDGSTWLGQPVGLRWMNTDGTLPNNYGLSASPRFVTDTNDAQGAEDKYEFYKDLVPTKVDFTLTSTPGDTVQSGEVALGLNSYWQAPKYPFDAQVGDYWYGITDLAWDGTVPIVEGGKPVTLTVTVSSAFDATRPVEGAEVTWTVGEQPPQTLATDANGQSKLVYTPKQEDIANDHILVKVTCTDALTHKTNKERALRAFVIAPWLDLLTMVLRNKADGSIVDPTALGMRLDHGGEYQLTLSPEDEYFIGDKITLGWFERSKRLGIEFSPKGEREMTSEGLSWDIVAGGESGVFTLYAWSEQLGEGVPFLLPGVQMSANLLEEVDVTVDGYGLESPLIFRRGEARTIKVKPKPGSPLPGLDWTSSMTFRSGGTLPPDKVSADPAFSDKRPMTEHGLEWAVTGVDASGTFGLDVHIDEFESVTLGDVALLSQHLIDEVDVTLDGSVLNGPMIFRRGEACKIKVKPKSGSPLLVLNGVSSMTYRGDSQLPADKVSAVPPFSDERPMIEQGLEWAVTGVDVSGTFGLDVHMDKFTGFTLTDAVLLSQRLIDEVDVTIDGDGLASPLIFRRGEARTIKVKPKSGSPLPGLNWASNMTFRGDSKLPPSKVSAVPPFRDKRPMIEQGLEWAVTGVDDSGTFGLDVHMDKFTGFTLRDAVLLSQHLIDEVDVTFDDSALDMESWKILRRKKDHKIKIKPKPGSPLLHVGGESSMSFVKGSLATLEAVPGYSVKRPMIAQGLEWTVKGGEISGTFGLDIHMEKFTGIPLRNMAVLSSNLEDELELTVDGKSASESRFSVEGKGP